MGLDRAAGSRSTPMMTLRLQTAQGGGKVYIYVEVEALLLLFDININNFNYKNISNSIRAHILQSHPSPCLTTSLLVRLSSEPPTLYHAFSNMSPEHDGLRQDGQPDQRVNTGRKISPHSFSMFDRV